MAKNESELIDFDNSGLTMQTTKTIKTKWRRWKMLHKYGPYLITLAPTGVCTVVRVEHEKTGSCIDLTDYDSI